MGGKDQGSAVPDDKPHILVVDDEADIRKPLADYLSRNGYRVSLAADGRDMDRVLAGAAIDLVVLDVMLPGEDGFALCRRLQESRRIPVVLLTALGEDTDRIVGLEIGADDYVTKPFNPRELLARIKAVLRRSAMLPLRRLAVSGTVRFEDWRYDPGRRALFDRDGVLIRLSNGEHLLLTTLIEHAGLVLSRDQLLDLTRGRDAQLFDRSIDNQISRLRRKIEPDPKAPCIILTHWGGGYQFAADVEWGE